MGEWYKDHYLTTKDGEAALRAALTNPEAGAQNKADVQKRLDELTQDVTDRCVISTKQKKFLQHVLETL